MSEDNGMIVDEDESNQLSLNESDDEENNSDFRSFSSESPSQRLMYTISNQFVSNEILEYILLQYKTSIHKTNKFTFVIDSGETSHMNPNVKCIVNFQAISGIVYLGNNNSIEITHSYPNNK